jgi:hypothetical protein
MAGLPPVLLSQVDLVLVLDRVPTQGQCLEVLLGLVLCLLAPVLCRQAHPHQEDDLRQASSRHLDDSLQAKALLLEPSVLRMVHLVPKALGHHLQGSDLAQDQCQVLVYLLTCKFMQDHRVLCLCIKDLPLASVAGPHLHKDRLARGR